MGEYHRYLAEFTIAVNRKAYPYKAIEPYIARCDVPLPYSPLQFSVFQDGFVQSPGITPALIDGGHHRLLV